MRKTNAWDYVYFGTAVRYLQDISADHPIHGEDLIVSNIESILEYMKQFRLPVSQRAAYRLNEVLEQLRKKPENHRLTSEESILIRQIMDELRLTITAEILGQVCYVVTDKRYPVDKLVDNIWGLMGGVAASRLPDVAKSDFEEAGKCIAFERPTAAAFHLLRATEDTLKAYYCHLVKRNRSTLMWGPMVESLRRKRNPPPAELLDHLDNIRRNFRNPTQHPEKRYDIEEVQDLFGLSVDVVRRMAAVLPD